MKILLTLFVLLFSSSVVACEYWSHIANRPGELKDYNLGVNYIEADAIVDALTNEIIANFENHYLSPFFENGDWQENPEYKWNLNYEVCFLSKSIDINDDGKEEILVYLGLAGNRNDYHYILQDGYELTAKNGYEYIGWKKIMEGSIIYLQETRTNHYFDLQLYNCCSSPPTNCSHNGEEYICKDE